MDHLDLNENAPKSHAEKLRGHETDAQKFNGHDHPETTRGATLVRARALLGRVLNSRFLVGVAGTRPGGVLKAELGA